jgi:hypothetical protein
MITHTGRKDTITNFLASFTPSECKMYGLKKASFGLCNRDIHLTIPIDDPEVVVDALVHCIERA